ncbi:MAG: cation:dicarboxylase symporter family transporter [Eubacterium sp.]|nr:cation:dicarboxylase symporter family transporter [Eubacterium sp.]
MITTLIAAFIAVIASFIFPQTMVLTEEVGEQTPPGGLGEVLNNLLMNIIVNPIHATANANYMGILLWAVIFGIALKKIASDSTKQMLQDFSDAVSQGVKWIINLAPFGICGLVFESVSSNGLNIFVDYGKIVALLVGSMLMVSLVINPIIVAICLKCNPYPLVWRCIKESGFTAFIMSVLAAVAACGASGVAGGSLLLIPMACSLFGISNDIAMQVVGVGFIIGVIQDSVETALNSSGDVLFAATAEYYEWRKTGKELPDFLSKKIKERLSLAISGL